MLLGPLRAGYIVDLRRHDILGFLLIASRRSYLPPITVIIAVIVATIAIITAIVPTVTMIVVMIAPVSIRVITATDGNHQASQHSTAYKFSQV
jgi:hypothetical protein